MSRRHKEQYVVMDSRAQHDMDSATVLEVMGHKEPSWKRLQNSWGGQGAVLVKWSEFKDGGYNKSTVVKEIE